MCGNYSTFCYSEIKCRYTVWLDVIGIRYNLEGRYISIRYACTYVNDRIYICDTRPSIERELRNSYSTIPAQWHRKLRKVTQFTCILLALSLCLNAWRRFSTSSRGSRICPLFSKEESFSGPRIKKKDVEAQGGATLKLRSDSFPVITVAPRIRLSRSLRHRPSSIRGFHSYGQRAMGLYTDSVLKLLSIIILFREISYTVRRRGSQSVRHIDPGCSIFTKSLQILQV